MPQNTFIHKMGEIVSQTTDKVLWFIQYKSVNKCKSVNPLCKGGIFILKIISTFKI